MGRQAAFRFRWSKQGFHCGNHFRATTLAASSHYCQRLRPIQGNISEPFQSNIMPLCEGPKASSTASNASADWFGVNRSPFARRPVNGALSAVATVPGWSAASTPFGWVRPHSIAAVRTS